MLLHISVSRNKSHTIPIAWRQVAGHVLSRGRLEHFCPQNMSCNLLQTFSILRLVSRHFAGVLVVMETELEREFPLLDTNCLFLTFVTNWATFHIVTCVSDTVATAFINLTYLLFQIFQKTIECASQQEWHKLGLRQVEVIQKKTC